MSSETSALRELTAIREKAAAAFRPPPPAPQALRASSAAVQTLVLAPVDEVEKAVQALLRDLEQGGE